MIQCAAFLNQVSKGRHFCFRWLLLLCITLLYFAISLAKLIGNSLAPSEFFRDIVVLVPASSLLDAIHRTRLAMFLFFSPEDNSWYPFF